MAQRDAGGVVSPVDQQAVSAAGGNEDAGIITHTGADWFSPLNPQKPSAPPEVAGRQLDFPSGYNLTVQPRSYDVVKFAELRALADAYDILRLVIETRKDQMARLEWAIKPRKKTKGKQADQKSDPRAEAIDAFFRFPDKVNAWDAWLRMLLEDMFVLDAPAMFVRRTRAGDLYALEPIDGGTIKRVIDAYGRTPAPPSPAYQQVLKGLPAVDYMTPNRDMFMAMLGQGAVGNRTVNGQAKRFPAGELIYRPRNMRTNRVYGYSPVEQIILTVNTALRRQIFTLQYFTEGNIPEAFIGVPESWTPDHIKSFQEWWDSVLEGNTGARRHAKFVPGGMDIKATKEPELKGVFDEWLARVVCYAFSINPQPFVSMMNRATAQTAKEASLEEGLAPTQHWVKQMIDFVIASEFNAPDLEFEWAEEDETNPVDQETVLTGYATKGGITLNELRDKLGLEADANPAASTLMVLTQTGYVPIDAYAAQMEAQQANTEATLAAAQAKPKEDAPEGKPATGSASTGPKNGIEKLQMPTDTNRALPVSVLQPKLSKLSWACVQHLEAQTLGDLLDKIKEPSVEKFGRFPLDEIEGELARYGLFVRPERLEKEVGEAAYVPFTKRALGPIAYPRRNTRRAANAAARIWNGVFDRQAKAVASGIRATLFKASEDDRQTADGYVASLDFSLTSSESADFAQQLATVASDSGSLAFAQIGADQDMFEQINDRAVAWSQDHAADLVTSVSDTTRELVRQAIADGTAEGLSSDEIAESIEALGAFSMERSLLIANTEIANANSQGALVGYKAAADAGVTVKKAWLLADEDVDDECADNADAGPIDLDDVFPSGDDAPLAHPRCRCVLIPVVGEDGEE